MTQQPQKRRGPLPGFGGRPKVDPELRVGENFSIALTRGEKALILAVDDRPAQWARRLLVRAARRAEKAKVAKDG